MAGRLLGRIVIVGVLVSWCSSARFGYGEEAPANADANADVNMELAQQLEKLGASVQELGTGMQQMKEGVEQLGSALRVTTVREHSKIGVFGELRAEALWSSARPIIPGAPLFLAPGPVAGFDQDTFDVHAKSTLLGAGFQGPTVGCFETGGLVLAALYSETVVTDIYGLLPLQAYGEIKNEHVRFAAGLQFDVFNPVIPTMVNFDTLWASGNTGAYRGQFRIERFLYPTCESQVTIQGAIGEALPTTIVNRRAVTGAVLSEDNGLPNFEGRLALGLGPLEGEGTAARRPFEVGVSGLVGEVRSTELLALVPPRRVVADVWGVGVDGRWRINERWGVQGELFRGETLGTYLGGVAQTVNAVTLTGIRSTGGWGEAYCYIHPCIHLHAGYGVDDPQDTDVSVGQIVFNETLFGTVFFELTESLRLGLEVSRRETLYRALPDNDGLLVHTQVQWSF